MTLRRNVIANYLGQAWVAVMGLAFIPVYIQYLGIEAWGLMGVIGLVQAWLALLDMGMTPTIGREMARFTAGEHTAQAICNLLRSLEFLAFGLAALICLVVWSASGWLAEDWLKLEALSPTVVRDGIAVMAWVIGMRFVESIYRSALFGLQRQVWYNVANAAMATLRGVGAVAVLALVSPTLGAFFVWLAAMSLLSLTVLALGVHRAMPRPPAPARASWATLQSVWRFAGGMTGIAFLVVLLTQVDKVLLSRMLTLQDFGYYSFAAMVAGTLYLLVMPITTALFPRLVERVAQKDEAALAHAYHQGAQMVSVVSAPVALLLVFHGEGVLYAWSADAALARTSGPILSLLAFGTLLNCLLNVPYQAQLAHGWTSLALKVNVAAVVLLVPALFWVVPHHGALGAAWVWIILNSGYCLVIIGLMHKRILAQEKWRWYGRDVLMPILGAIAALVVVGGLKPDDFGNRVACLVYLSFALTAAITGATLAIRDYRKRVFFLLRRSTSV